jgi:Flp pilus assembly protein TadB
MPVRTLLFVLFGLGIGTGLCLLYAARNPLPPTTDATGTGTVPHAGSFSPRRMVVAVVGTGLAYAATGWIAALPVALAGVWFLPTMLGRDHRQEHDMAVIDAISVFTEMLRDTLSAASGLNQALTVACRHAPPALQPAADDLAERLGAREGTTRDALHAFADQIADPTCDLIALALAAASEHPTRDLAAMLTSLASTARDQAAMRIRVTVAQARTRTAIRMITATTLGLAALLLLADRAYLANYDTVVGQVVLLWVGAIFALALRWLRSLATVPLPQRLWAKEAEAQT